MVIIKIKSLIDRQAVNFSHFQIACLKIAIAQGEASCATPNKLRLEMRGHLIVLPAIVCEVHAHLNGV